MEAKSDLDRKKQELANDILQFLRGDELPTDPRYTDLNKAWVAFKQEAQATGVVRETAKRRRVSDGYVPVVEEEFGMAVDARAPKAAGQLTADVAVRHRDATLDVEPFHTGVDQCYSLPARSLPSEDTEMLDPLERVDVMLLGVLLVDATTLLLESLAGLDDEDDKVMPPVTDLVAL